MEYMLPKIGKAALPLPHFPTRHQAFIFRAAEYISTEKIAKILHTSEQNVNDAANSGIVARLVSFTAKKR